MSWWDDAFSAVWDFAKENPAIAGAGAGLVMHHLTGGKGEDNLAALAGGAALGAGANYLFGSQSPVPAGVSSAPTTGNGIVGTGGAGKPGESPVGGYGPAPVSSEATMGAGIVGTGGAGKPGENAMGGYGVGGNTGVTGDTGGTMMGQLDAGLQKVRKFGSDNEGILSLAGKGIASYLGNKSRADAVAPVQAYNNDYRGKADEAMANNRQLVAQTNANVGKQNAVMDQLSADASAIDPQRAGVQAYTAGLTRVAGQANRNAAAETSKGYSAATVAANKRRGAVGATTEASTAAEAARTAAQSRRTAGLGSVKYAGYQQEAVPNYDSGYATGVSAANGASGSDTAGAVGLFEDIFGLEKKKASNQVGA